MSRTYENINELDRKSLESLLTKIAYDAYNKGVNFGLAKGDERTEQRIIKLLEDRASNLLSHTGSECDCKVQGEECLAIIALIKGENK